MATIVGTQKDFIGVIKQLIELDYDAVGAYEAAIKNLENPKYQQKLEEFKEDHNRHIAELSLFLSRCNEIPPTGPDNIKRFLAKGKVEIAALFGDQNILNAMLSNEEDTNTAYERVNSRIAESLDGKIAKIIASGLDDERKHKKWLQDSISKK